MRAPSLLCALLTAGFFALLVLGGCGQESPPAERQDKAKAAPKQDSQQRTSPTAAEAEPGGVGNTAEVGPFLVTLNDVEPRLSGEDNQEDTTTSWRT
jgi:hypothetical protein